ncbi:MAG: hypothetical protein IT243_01025 [Bacteroidia bacterium]|nr:hypothetical protein [Bacteroidia bacterium]
MAKEKNKKQTINKNNNEGTDILYKLEKFLSKNNLFVSLGILFLALIFSLLMFDVKISIGHDDALYIESAHTWSKNFTGYFYNANAPLYVMFLIIPIKIWGLNLILLKSFSVLFFIGSLWFFYKAFKNRISYTILFSTLFITASNWFILSYASLTYTECFFMFIASVFLLIFFNLIDKVETNDWTLKSTWKNWVYLGFILFVLSISRNIAVVAFIAVAVYFVIRFQWKAALLSIVSFGIFRAAYEYIKTSIWGDKAVLSDQMEIILRKEAYNASAGYETFSGFFDRFEGNIIIYLAGRFWEILGFKKDDGEFNPMLALIVVALILIGLVVIIKRKEKYFLASLLYSGAILGATFFALQTSWGQGRFVMIHIPFILLILFYLFKNWFKNIGALFIAVFVIIAGVGLNKTFNITKTNLKYLPKNLKGDLFAGYTEDWVNYLKLSKWCGDSLPKDSKIACRKAPMSFVYASNLSYFPIYRVISENADTIYNTLKKNKVTHVLFANLRLNPKQSGDVKSVPQAGMPSIYLAYQDQQQKSIINTLHNYFAPLAQKNPQMFELVKIMGDDEEALLYKINY